MKKLISFFLLFASVMLVVPVVAAAETIKEAVERKAKQAEEDRKKVSIYAVTVEALQSGRKLPGMPENLIEAARDIGGATTYRMVGKSEVRVEGKYGFVTFTMQASASSVPDAFGRITGLRELDPVESLIGWVLGTQNGGLVWAKIKSGGTSMAIPSVLTCMGMTSAGYYEISGGISEACERFGLGGIETIRPPFKTDVDVAREREFLTNLVSKHGASGILTRETATKVLEGEMSKIKAIMQVSEEKTGYITYGSSSGTYMATAGHLLQARIHSRSSRIEPGGHVELAVLVYSDRVSAVEVELWYQDGTAVAQTDLGNLARASFTRGDLVISEDSVSGFEIIKIKLPLALKPGKIQVVASAVNQDGKQIVDRETIGSFEYPISE